MPLVAAGRGGAPGAALGAINGALVAGLGLPAIVVTLATMVGLREGLRWATEGVWIQDLPARFQWFGLGQAGGRVAIVAAALVVFAAVRLGPAPPRRRSRRLCRPAPTRRPRAWSASARAAWSSRPFVVHGRAHRPGRAC